MLKSITNYKNVVVGAFLTLLAGAAFADPTPVDFTPLTSQVIFTSVIAAILAIAVILAGLYVAITGSKIILRFVKGA